MAAVEQSISSAVAVYTYRTLHTYHTYSVCMVFKRRRLTPVAVVDAVVKGEGPKVATKASFRISHPKSDDDATQYLTPMLPPHSDCRRRRRRRCRRRHVVPHCRHHVLCVSSSECIRTPCACVSVFSAALLSYNAATDVPRTISTPYTPPPTVGGMVCRT